jgi:hypothetical protein
MGRGKHRPRSFQNRVWRPFGLGLVRAIPGPGGTSTADCGETRFRGILYVMADPLIERAEIVALLFNVSDIASALERIERLPEEDDGEEEADEG